jgi:uncharacterized membrane protein YkoI
MNRKFALVVCILLSFSAIGSAKDKALTKSQLPLAVRKTADEQSKGAIVRGYSSEVENGKLEYEVQLTVNGRSRDVTIASDGRVLEVEDEVPQDELPAAVREAIQKRAGSGTVSKVESLTKGGKLVAYEAHVRNGAKRSEIQVGPNGEPLAHPE